MPPEEETLQQQVYDIIYWADESMLAYLLKAAKQYHIDNIRAL